MWRSVAIGVVLAGLLAGCSLGGGGQAAGNHATGRLVGTFVTDGGVSAPTGSHSDITPVQNAPILILGTSDSGKHIEQGATTDHDGKFAVNLPPGQYTIENGVYTKLKVPAHVAAGSMTRKRLVVHVL